MGLKIIIVKKVTFKRRIMFSRQNSAKTITQGKEIGSKVDSIRENVIKEEIIKEELSGYEAAVSYEQRIEFDSSSTEPYNPRREDMIIRAEDISQAYYKGKISGLKEAYDGVQSTLLKKIEDLSYKNGFNEAKSSSQPKKRKRENRTGAKPNKNKEKPYDYSSE